MELWARAGIVAGLTAVIRPARKPPHRRALGATERCGQKEVMLSVRAVSMLSVEEFELPDGRKVRITDRALEHFDDHDECVLSRSCRRTSG